jgi:hypothetical protein
MDKLYAVRVPRVDFPAKLFGTLINVESFKASEGNRMIEDFLSFYIVVVGNTSDTDPCGQQQSSRIFRNYDICSHIFHDL